MVKRSFPDLHEVDVERFGFQVYNGRGAWVGVMEEAWKMIGMDPPSIWIITIQELPEEREQREFKNFYPNSCLPRKANFERIITEQTGIATQRWNLRGWKAHLVNGSILCIVTIIATKSHMIDGSFWGHAKVGGIAALAQVIVHAAIGGISAM
jgi:hypothetical protein